MTRALIAVAALFLGTSAHAGGVYHAKGDAAMICRDTAPTECRAVDGSVLMERMQWYSDPWRVRVIEGGEFAYYRVRKDEIEPALDAHGEPLQQLCIPGGGGVYSRAELGPDGQVYVKRFLITITCKDGKAYSTTKPLN